MCSVGALLLELMVDVVDLAIDMSVSNTCRLPNLLSHALEEVYPSSMPSSLTYSFLFSTSDDREAFRRFVSEHISLLSGRLSAILAEAHTYMSQVETYCVCVPTSSTSSTVMHVRNTCTGDSRFLAHSAYRCSVRGTASSLSASCRRRGQYHGRVDAV